MLRPDEKKKTGAEIDGVASCPRCDSTMITRRGSIETDLWKAICTDCGYETEEIKTYKELVRVWNEIPREE